MSMDHWGEMFARVDAEVANLRTRLAAAEAERDEARGLKVPPTVDEINAALMRAAVAKVERDVAIARAEAAEAEVARLRGAREAALREAAGVLRDASKKHRHDADASRSVAASGGHVLAADILDSYANVIDLLDAPAANGGGAVTPRELADALESIAPHLHTLGVAEPCAIEAAQTIRALEAAATEYRRAVEAYEASEEGSGERLHEAEVALDEALRGGGQ